MTPTSGNGLNRGSVSTRARLRLGIVGCGAITENAHLPAALTSPFVQLVGLNDSNPARLRYIERQYGLSGLGMGEYRDLFDRVDGVILALPNHVHAEIGIEFLNRGISVLCEKPLASTSEECNRLCAAARSTSTVLAVGYVTRFFPSTHLTKRLLDSGFIGVVESFDYEFGTPGGWAPLSGYNLSAATSGGGVLVVSGSHFLDRMFYLFGEPRLLSFADDNRGGVEANCIAWFETTLNATTVRGRVTLSKTHNLTNRLRIVGERGVLEIGEGQANSVTFYPAESELRHEIRSCASAKEENYFRVQLEDFAHAVQTGVQPMITGEQASASVALIEQCYRRATRLSEPWVNSTLDRLSAALPAAPMSTKPTDVPGGNIVS